jgi:hypothetical protein
MQSQVTESHHKQGQNTRQYWKWQNVMREVQVNEEHEQSKDRR